MMQVTSSAMRAVRSRPIPCSIRRLTSIGLYYKLHHQHRPVAMKKQEIKRRKRVVPAPETASQTAQSVTDYSPSTRTLDTPAFEQSASPDPSTAVETREVYTPERKGPIAIDFTHYYGTTTSSTLQPPTPSGAASPRKRSRSATSIDREVTAALPTRPVTHRPNAISSILNPRTEQSNIDPSLAAPSAGPSPHSQEDKLARKARLKREAEAMREELERRQREIEELEHD
jgi:GATA-binding protein